MQSISMQMSHGKMQQTTKENLRLFVHDDIARCCFGFIFLHGKGRFELDANIYTIQNRIDRTIQRALICMMR